jgi:hypothetical protein
MQSFEIMKMHMFVILDKTKPDIENASSLKLMAVTLTTVRLGCRSSVSCAEHRPKEALYIQGVSKGASQL